MADDVEPGMIASSLTGDAASLDQSWRNWRALGDVHGCDVRSGSHVVRVFRAGALAGAAGSAAFASAYAELFARSGERPRRTFIDSELRQALGRAMSELSGDDHRCLEWLLGVIDLDGGYTS
jgi:hypothetical protein